MRVRINLLVSTFIKDLGEYLVAEIFFAGASQYRLDLASGSLGIKLLSVLSLSGGFVFVSLKLVETKQVKATCCL